MERDQVLFHLRTPRFADQTLADVSATQLDEGIYPAHGDVVERRSQRHHLIYQEPENCWPKHATGSGPGDISKRMGPVKRTHFYLGVILDTFSRRVVGWRAEQLDSANQFQVLFDDAMAKYAVPPDQPTQHADRGGPSSAKAVALMLVDFRMVKFHWQATYIE
ncbi:MAG: hypothetical protein Q8Q26_07250 [Pseudorhodobacter sp.]|nr:hypothetical protein [Pseudorhodobacter sp.]